MIVMSDENPTPKKRRMRSYKYKEEYCDLMIEKMSEGYSYEAVAGFCGVCRDTLYEWEKKFPEWKAAKKEAFTQCQIFWEKAGLQGMFMGGKETPFNSAVWIFNMKNRFNWSDRVHQDVKTEVTLEKLVGDTFEEDE